MEEVKAKVKNSPSRVSRRVNPESKADVEKVTFKDVDADNVDAKGNYTGTLVNKDTKEKAAKRRKEAVKLGKTIQVRTVHEGGNMYYFDAQIVITDHPTVVPDSSWIQLQIKAGKLEIVK